MGMKHVETGTYTPVTVLVTGFGAFPGARSNPTGALLETLVRQQARLLRLGIALRTTRIPVVYGMVAPALQAAVARDRPDAILHLGLASRRRVISIETQAVNRANPLHPDAAGKRSAQVLRPNGPGAWRATYPAARVAAKVRLVWPAVALSRDGGDYVCNATLHESLAERLAPCVGFIHVPRLRDAGQPCRRTRRSRPGMEELTRAVAAAVLVCAREVRRFAARDERPDRRTAR